MPKLKFKMSDFLLFDIFLEYQIAETTILDIDAFFEITQELLEEDDYKVKSIPSGKIMFKGFPRSKGDLARITDGDFEFIGAKSTNDIIITYRQFLIGPIFIIFIIALMGFSSSPGVLLMMIPFVLQEIVRANKLKKTAERILSVVADPT